MSMLDDIKDLPHTKWGELLNKSARKTIHQATPTSRVFIFDEEASGRVGHFVRTCPDILSDQIEFAIPPYDNTYIEIDQPSFLKAAETRDKLCDPLVADRRLGFLSVGPDIFVLANSLKHPGGWISPIGLIRIPDIGPMSVHASLSGELVERDNPLYETTKKILLASTYLDLTPDQRNRFSNYYGISYWGEPEHAKTLIERFTKESAGEARIYAACLLMLYQKKHIIVQDHGPRRGLSRGKARVYMAHSTVTIQLDDEVKIRRAFKASERAEARRHEVRTHYGHRHTDFHCEHQWEERPGGVHKQWTCPKCGGLRYLRKAFLRGNGALGFVMKSYKVTSDAVVD